MTAVVHGGAAQVVGSLTVKPYAVQVFTDFERGKEFTTLFYRRKEARLQTVLAFVQDVLEGIAQAGLIVSTTDGK